MESPEVIGDSKYQPDWDATLGHLIDCPNLNIDQASAILESMDIDGNFRDDY